jgi:hypothetical protein
MIRCLHFEDRTVDGKLSSTLKMEASCSYEMLVPTYQTRSPHTLKPKLGGFSPQASYTDRATAACRRSWCPLLRIEGVMRSVQRIPMAVNLDFLDPEPLLFHSSSSPVIPKRLSGPCSMPTTPQKIWQCWESNLGHLDL